MGEILAPSLTEFDIGLSSECAKIKKEPELGVYGKKDADFLY